VSHSLTEPEEQASECGVQTHRHLKTRSVTRFCRGTCQDWDNVTSNTQHNDWNNDTSDITIVICIRSLVNPQSAGVLGCIHYKHRALVTSAGWWQQVWCCFTGHKMDHCSVHALERVAARGAKLHAEPPEHGQLGTQLQYCTLLLGPALVQDPLQGASQVLHSSMGVPFRLLHQYCT
jgi:hypothetical protein